MTASERASLYNARWPERPPLAATDRWLYGVWEIGNNYRATGGLYGSYPPGYVERVLAMFPDARRGLHLFSGTVKPNGWMTTVDRVRRAANCPEVLADACALPFADGTFDFIMADPPYSAPDAERYGVPMVDRRKVLREAARVTAPGGHLVWLDTVKPMYRKIEWTLWGEIAVLRSTNHRVRCAFAFERALKEPQPIDSGCDSSCGEEG